MKIVNEIEHLAGELKALRAESGGLNARVALVPTMGALHEGHLSLVKLASEVSDIVAVSIFVNPAQFNNPADLDSYPRDLDADLAKLAEYGVSLVFSPPAPSMYSDDHESWVELEELPLPLEGAGRPGHFRGVTTVVSMLFNLFQPEYAVFGEKDFQQLRVVEKMVADLKFQTEIVRGPLYRESTGLAMSSRNVRLSKEGREKALCLSNALRLVQEEFRSGEKNSAVLLESGRALIEKEGDVEIDYLEIMDEETLQPIEVVSDRPARVLTTCIVEGVRLLDNVRVQGE